MNIVCHTECLLHREKDQKKLNMEIYRHEGRRQRARRNVNIQLFPFFKLVKNPVYASSGSCDLEKSTLFECLGLGVWGCLSHSLNTDFIKLYSYLAVFEAKFI